MAYEIVLAPQAIEDLGRLDAHVRAEVRDALEIHLRHEPTKVSRSRLQRLRGMTRPQYRLRVDGVRVFYDVVGAEVQVVAIVEKARAGEWLDSFGEAV